MLNTWFSFLCLFVTLSVCFFYLRYFGIYVFVIVLAANCRNANGLISGCWNVLCIFIVRFLNYCFHPLGDFFCCYLFSFLFFLQMHSVLKDVLSYCSVCILNRWRHPSATLNCKSFPPHRRIKNGWFRCTSTLLYFKINYLPLHVFSFITWLYAWVWWCGQQYHNIQFVYGNLLLKHQILMHRIFICNHLY